MTKFQEDKKSEKEISIPEWQKQEVREQIETYQENPDQVRDFDLSLDDIDKSYYQKKNPGIFTPGFIQKLN